MLFRSDACESFLSNLKKKKKLEENIDDELENDCFVHLDDIARSTRKFSSLGL